MAGATVIDQLIVKLGLDPRDFTKGQKQVAAEMIKTEGQVKKSSQGMGSEILGFTKKLLGVAAAAVVVRKAVGYVSELSVSVRQLGIDSRNFGIAANELRNFQNLGEMFGGKAEEVTKTVGNLTKAVYDLAYNGQISDSLIMLGRLGVQFQDTAGNARDFKDIVLDTQKAIQNAMQSGTSRANANQLLLQAGFDPGLAQAMLENRVGSELARQQGRRQVTNESLQAATAWEKSATNRDQAIAAGALRGLPAQAKAGTIANDAIASAAEYMSDATLSGTLDDIGETLSKAGDKIKDGADSVVDAFEGLGARLKNTLQTASQKAREMNIQHAARTHGVDPGMLESMIAAENESDPMAVNGLREIDAAARRLRQRKDVFAKQGMSEDDQYWNALRVAGGATPTPNAQGASMTPTSNNTEMNIGKVEIHTQATDANGIAGDFANATRRKMNAAQAEKGMN